jgi:hypothetical protein
MNKKRSDFGVWVGLVASLCFIALCIVCWKPPTVSAQAPTRFAQQTFPFNFTFTPNGAANTFAIPNLGQSAHTIALPVMNHTGTQCVWWFQGSNDNSNFTIMAAIQTNLAQVNTAVAQGQYTFFQLVFNPGADAACTSTVATTISYVGYQFPIPLPPQSTNFILTSVQAPEYILNQDAAPEIVNGLQCYNPNGSAAFMEIFDAAGSGTAPTLPGSPVFFFEIPASSSVSITTNNLRLKTGGWLAGVTAIGGSTTVTTALTCTAQMNLQGPFS